MQLMEGKRKVAKVWDDSKMLTVKIDGFIFRADWVTFIKKHKDVVDVSEMRVGETWKVKVNENIQDAPKLMALRSIKDEEGKVKTGQITKLDEDTMTIYLAPFYFDLSWITPIEKVASIEGGQRGGKIDNRND